MQLLYPEIKPFARHELAVEKPHVLYVDESGQADGLPVVFIHGGPGAGCDSLSRRVFDPSTSGCCLVAPGARRWRWRMHRRIPSACSD